MATHKKKRNRSWSASHRKAGAKKRNPGRRMFSKANTHRRRRHNPGGQSVTRLLTDGIWATVGAVGSKLLTQVVLGANNTGIFGYIGNIVAGGAIGFAAQSILKNKEAGYAVYIGTGVQLILRAISDFTPYGQYASLTGVGDYQVSNFVTPQRYVDALHGSMVEVPQGWGPGAPVAISSAAPPAGHGMSGYSPYAGGSGRGYIYENM